MDVLVAWQRQIRTTADGRLLRPIRPLVSPHDRLRYDWVTDYPVGKQARASAEATSNMVLEFKLDEDEVEEFKRSIGSNLNGTLPLQVAFGQRSTDLSVKKPGRGQATLTKKSNRIAYFVSRRIRFEYIPAIRTASSASRVIEQLVERELARLEDDSDYKDALLKIEELQRPIFEELAETIQSTVARFLPSVRSVELKTRREERYRGLRRDVEIVVDDGQQTILARKGDGVQSLTALALMRHASEQSLPGVSSVIAIEEPESHLHPRAVHELKSVITGLAAANQVVLTSHSPLFVNPNVLGNTIVVRSSKASPATHGVSGPRRSGRPVLRQFTQCSSSTPRRRW